MLYMIIEHYRNGDPQPVYRRFREQGRMAPEGLRYVTSWVTDDLRRRPYRKFDDVSRARVARGAPEARGIRRPMTSGSRRHAAALLPSAL